MSETIGERLMKCAKAEKGWTKETLAANLEVSPETVRRWRAGETAPNRKRVEKIAEVLQKSKHWILFGIEEPQQPPPPKTRDRADLVADYFRKAPAGNMKDTLFSLLEALAGGDFPRGARIQIVLPDEPPGPSRAPKKARKQHQ